MKKICVDIDTFTMVDDEDYILLFNYCTWHLDKKEYVVGKYNKKRIRMNRLIASWMGLDMSLQIDHEDRNKLNNQRCNLRPATNGQNRANSGLNQNSTTDYRGVTPRKDMFYAQINNGKKKIHLGSFFYKEEAAYAYNIAAQLLYKEFATVNLIPESDVLTAERKRTIQRLTELRLK